ncbi:hypothetical protein [Tenacibaculum sp. 190524A02b]|uniref:hypothetical protein n=1 Tax=Tenacibaculum vairaonense TaxID=3137860 RepID=UPI0031FA8CAA
MLKPINLKDELVKIRGREFTNTNVLNWVEEVFNDLDNQYQNIKNRLEKNSQVINNELLKQKLEVDSIFHINQIQKICIDYRLRFLDTHLFKGEFPIEAITKIRQLEKDHQITLKGFKIIAPSKLFKLKKADDPLLFVPIRNDYYYLIHQWGKDLHPLRKLKYWSVKNIENLALTLFIISSILTLITYPIFFRDKATFVYILLLFMFYLKGAIGWALFYGISSGKNFSKYAWNSKYDKIS